MAKSIGEMKMAKIYDLYLQKCRRKGRTQAELDAVLGWLTGWPAQRFATLPATLSVADFCAQANWSAQAGQITGMICGVRVETIADPLMRRVREMDKVVDELAKGKPVEKIQQVAQLRRSKG
ncbi:DUF2200 family protein [Lacticaseibacillus hegangensis]|uniref:DUF2200 family protein n=1 Tax=Lacticaseibacillus hegangensis TaxID=2486010 RepID=A0ABW4CY15_9LACO|nr:DUF2200 family protein [Lacticaseibacillus hegangensis]